MTSDSGPPSKPPRSALTARDMLAALVVLALLVLAAGGVMRSCTFAPAGPTVDASRLPVVDATAELAGLAPGSPFPVRVPAVPPDWRANAVDAVPGPDGRRFVRVGYLTPDGRYLRLVQSDATEEALLRGTGGGPATAEGVVDVAGQRWVAYTGGNSEPIWVTEVAGGEAAPVRLLITGSGSEAQLRTLASAALTGEVVAPGAPR